MTTTRLDELAGMLAPGSRGGIAQLERPANLESLRSIADAAGARLAVLDGPASKGELLDDLAESLALPDWFGRNWDALDEVLSVPESDLTGPVLIAWLDTVRLEEADRGASRMFQSIVDDACAHRHEQGNGPLVLALVSERQTEQMFERQVAWEVSATEGVDAAWVSVAGGRLAVRGDISAQLPRPYSVRYTLETADAYETRTLFAEATTFEGIRQLDLRQERGRWLVNGMPQDDLDGALDCDIYACPLTNTMPILRHELHRRPGEVTFLMAFVQLPDLSVVPSEQTYTHLRLLDDGNSVVRYSSGDFESDLIVDPDGLVVEYPKLGAIRIGTDD